MVVFILMILASSPQQSQNVLSVLDFGAKADGITNNQQPIMRAMQACEAKGGCELHFPLPPSYHTDLAPEPQPYGPAVVSFPLLR